MVATNATLGLFLPFEVDNPQSGQAKFDKRGTLGVLVFNPLLTVPYHGSEQVVFAANIPRPAATFFSSTTGIKVNIGWSSASALVAGKVEWAAAWELIGQTDLPSPYSDANFPAFSATNEVAVSTTVTASPAGGLTVTSISCTLANIKNGQTTAPAVGDYFRLRIRRKVEDTANDTMNDIAYFHYAELVDY